MSLSFIIGIVLVIVALSLIVHQPLLLGLLVLVLALYLLSRGHP